jgi:hypothetical protein
MFTVTTMLTGQTIYAEDVTPSCGLFLIFRGEKYTVVYNVTQAVFMYGNP